MVKCDAISCAHKKNYVDSGKEEVGNVENFFRFCPQTMQERRRRGNEAVICDRSRGELMVCRDDNDLVVFKYL